MFSPPLSHTPSTATATEGGGGKVNIALVIHKYDKVRKAGEGGLSSIMECGEIRGVANAKYNKSEELTSHPLSLPTSPFTT